ncbi:MAG: DUF1990 domain-containing protein [Magnetococcales bacterium]|nr:DUF1990 domain-containing protein [Magnetococcales bacterium]NGZ27966.1 DUF1990 domain-containing protein [Magnetococcales bacterium]
MKKPTKHIVFIKKPGRKSINAFITDQRENTFSYEEVGSTRRLEKEKKKLSKDYRLAHYRFVLGRGENIYAHAKEALRQWKCFDLDWVQLCWPETIAAVGTDLAILGNSLGLWLINAVRILDVFDEQTTDHRFGFAMGTLPDHMIVGEERMQVIWNQEEDLVYYDLCSFSRKQRWLAKMGALHVHRMQKLFALESGLAMQRAVDHMKKEAINSTEN